MGHQRLWSSGRIKDFHSFSSGSIPDRRTLAGSFLHYNKTETRVIVMDNPAAIIRKKQIQRVQDARYHTIMNLRKTMKPRRLGAPTTEEEKKLHLLVMEHARLFKKGKGRTRRLRKRSYKQ